MYKWLAVFTNSFIKNIISNHYKGEDNSEDNRFIKEGDYFYKIEY